MAQAPERSIRERLLTIVMEHYDRLHGGNLEEATILEDVKQRMHFRSSNPPDAEEEAVLTEWHELFRTGILAWGYNLSHPRPPFLHLTQRGRKVLQNITRDPSNTAGYLRHLDTLNVPVSNIARAYVVEALECYVAGLYKAAAVMIGAAAEASILGIRDLVVERLQMAGKVVPAQLNSLSIKTVTDALGRTFQSIDKKTHRELREKFEAHWGALTHEIRTTRNDAGHPASIDPVTEESVHASLLLFPVLTTLTGELLKWVADDATTL